MSSFVFDPRSIEDAYKLTMLIKTGIHEDATLIEQLMPLRGTKSRQIKIKTRDYDPAALGQFKALNANTPTRSGGGKITTDYLELVDLEEKEVLRASDLIALKSLDEEVALAAARDVVQVGIELAQRNRQLSRWMRWQALKDALTITYQDGVAITVDYDQDNTDSGMSATHQPDVHSSAPWNNAASDIIGTVQGWIDTLGEDAEVDGQVLIVNKNTWRYMQKNTAIKGFLLDHYGPLGIPSLKAVASMIWDVDPNTPGGGQILVENGYYRDANDARQRFLPDGYALLTTPWEVDGEPIAVLWDGPVVRVQGESLVVENNPGALAETYINKESKQFNIRVATSRMPWIRRECVMYARVY